MDVVGYYYLWFDEIDSEINVNFYNSIGNGVSYFLGNINCCILDSKYFLVTVQVT